MLAAPAVPLPQPACPGAIDLVRLVMRFNLQPEADLHPSWLPANWPVPHRLPARMGPGARAVLAQVLFRRQMLPASADYNFDSRVKRLALLDSASLRRLAAYVGFGVHLPLFKQRSAPGPQLRRQARRLDADGADFVRDRMPQLTELKMDLGTVQQRPASAGRLVTDRGYRLLLGASAAEGDEVLRRIQRKLPRRISAMPVPQLAPGQTRQLHELMLSCIVPERLPQWDWLF
jgi:type III secretion protein K